MRQLGELLPDQPSVIVAVVRHGRLFVPHGDDQLEIGDDTYFISPADQVMRTLSIFGQEESKTRRVLIIGGGNVGLYVAKQIEERQPNLRVKVIEASRARAVEIADQLGRTVVLNGTALSADLLREAEIASVDTVAALTNDDQVNILTSVLAKQLGAQRSLCLINTSGFANVTQTFGIDSHVNPRTTTVSRILQHVRRGRIRAIHSVQNGAGEVIEAEVLETSAILGKPLKDLGLSEGVRFGAIVRGGKVLKPSGTMQLEPKDRAILFAAAGHVREVEHLFRVSLEYF
jgi:trk system potassium uptake protein TrkA